MCLLVFASKTCVLIFFHQKCVRNEKNEKVTNRVGGIIILKNTAGVQGATLCIFTTRINIHAGAAQELAPGRMAHVSPRPFRKSNCEPSAFQKEQLGTFPSKHVACYWNREKRRRGRLFFAFTRPKAPTPSKFSSRLSTSIITFSLLTHASGALLTHEHNYDLIEIGQLFLQFLPQIRGS